MATAVQGPYGQGFAAGMAAAEKTRLENQHLRAALEEIAAGEHGFRRPAGAIARAALNGEPLPGWDR